MFAKRLIQPELLDTLPPDEARPNLADLVRINRHFGGHSVLRKSLERLPGRENTGTFLDIGAASGDTALLIGELYPAWSVTNLDYNLTNIEKARAPKLLADAFALPFREASFDYVGCSLFLHHFSDAEIVSLLRSFYRVARRALLVCDLERHILPYLFLQATKPLYGWNEITVHDGLRSVRAALKRKELGQLAQAAGLSNVDLQVYRPAFRLSMVAVK